MILGSGGVEEIPMTRVGGEPLPLVFENLLAVAAGGPRGNAEFTCMVVEGGGRRAEPKVLDPGNRT